MRSENLTIGTVSQASGVKVPTIRYYEQVGLMPEPPRTDGNRRTYGRADLDRLTFIRHSRELGFDIDEIRTLLSLQDQPNQSCEQADRIAQTHLVEVRQKIASLMALQKELERMVEGCSHGHVGECRVIEILADHNECRHHHHGAAASAGVGG